MSDIAIGIDLGGTRIKAAAVQSDGAIVDQCYFPTNDASDATWKETVATAVSRLARTFGSPDTIVGISAPGLPSKDHCAIAFMPGRMQGLESFSWREHLGRPAYVLNDAVAALMAETMSGAAKGRRNVVMLTLGTGVGGAILINGEPYLGAFNKAGHIGHMVINDEGECDVTGIPGSLEDAIGNCSIVKRSGGKFNSTHDMLQAYRAGDAFAGELWLKSVRQLAIALASLTNILSPEMFVIGGGIAEAGDLLFEPLNSYMDQYEWRAGGGKVEICKAAHGDMAGSVGAASFAMHQSAKSK